MSSHLATRSFYCGEKSDGVRMFLYVRHHPRGGNNTQGYIVDVRGDVIKLDDEFVATYFKPAPASSFDPKTKQQQQHNSSNLTSCIEEDGCVISMFDGELVTSRPDQQQMFLVFDTIFIHGNDVGSIEDFSVRMEQARHFFKPMPPPNNNNNNKSLDILIHVKTFYPLKELHQLVSYLKPLPGHNDLLEGAIFKDEVRECLNDGIVFVPLSRPYYAHNCLKWKPSG
jgi:hypothetical protein